MSFHRNEARGKWEVRYRDESKKQRSKLFERKRDAQIFDGKIRERKALGELAMLDAGRETLDHYVSETWRPIHTATLAENTRREYERTYKLHIAPRLGDLPLRAIEVEIVQRFQADLISSGVGPHARHKAMSLLGSILQRAFEARRIPSNQVRLVRREQLPDSEERIPLAPITIEIMRRNAVQIVRGRPEPDQRTRMILSLFGYAGARPHELRALRWQDVGERTLLIHTAKTSRYRGKSRRSVDLLAPLAADLREWNLICGRPGDDEFVIASERGGGQWTDSGYKLWAKRKFRPLLDSANVTHPATPYNLRHGFASLLLRETGDLKYVAEQLGHGVDVLAEHYAHVFKELRGQPPITAEAAIRRAREQSKTALSA